VPVSKQLAFLKKVIGFAAPTAPVLQKCVRVKQLRRRIAHVCMYVWASGRDHVARAGTANAFSS